MMELLHRGLLAAGMILMQVAPAVSSPPTNFTDWLLQALPNVPIYVILAYIVINMQRDNAKQSERRDKHENDLTTALVVERQRIDAIEEDRREQWDTQARKEVDRDNRYIESFQAFGDATNRTADILSLMRTDAVAKDRVLSDAVSSITTLVTVGSKPLRDVGIDVGKVKDTNEEISTVVGKVYEILLVNFPSGESLEVRFETLKKAMIEAIEQACEKAKHDTSEVPTVIEANVHIVPPANEGDAEGEAA